MPEDTENNENPENDLLDIIDPYETAIEEAAIAAESESESEGEPEADPKAEETGEASEPVVDTEEEFAVTIDKDLYDDDLIDQFKSMQRHYDRQIEKLNGQLSSMSRQAEEFAANQLFDAIDQPERFGIGSVKADSAEAQNRQRVIEEMNTLKVGYESTNREIPSENDLVAKALHSAFGEEVAEKVRRDFTEKIASRHNSRIAKPNGRVSKPRNSVVEATRNVAALMRDRGLTDSLDNFD